MQPHKANASGSDGVGLDAADACRVIAHIGFSGLAWWWNQPQVVSSIPSPAAPPTLQSRDVPASERARLSITAVYGHPLGSDVTATHVTPR
ncbi:hypothetical protein FQA47_007897 [Oryzias melastigma]|uniref:Uncharacterized protein n=1 Tax=Oryzias melastigma TaxID=30732 RepID=A0A834C9F6_ORYME|nr:hypothetical protein FQA47_007897 [Oryzias melastigma]